MRGVSRFRWGLFYLCGAALFVTVVKADDDKSALQTEYARLASALNGGDMWAKRQAAETLLLVRPPDVANPDVRKLVARGYRSLATESTSGPSAESIRGLVIWGGKYSLPILIELLEKSRTGAPKEVFDAIASQRDPRGAEALAKQLGSFWNHDAAVGSLRKMGSVAEPSLLIATPVSNPKIALAGVQLLGDVGSEKSLSLLDKATESRNPEVKQAARDAMKKIRLRKKNGKSVDEELVDANSPFAPPTGPPLDILALKAAQTAAAKSQSAGSNSSGSSATSAITDAEKGDWSKVETVAEQDPKGRSVPADPATLSGDPSFAPQRIKLSGLSGQPSAFDVWTSGLTPFAAIVCASSKTPALGRIEIVNLADGKSVASTQIIGGTDQLCFISPSGSRVLVVSRDATFYKNVRLDVWDLKDGKLKENSLWYPYAGKPNWTNTLKWTAWANDDQILTLNGDNSLVLWQVNGKKAIYKLDGKGTFATAALSPGGKYFAYANWSGIKVYRTADCEGVAHIGDSGHELGGIAFSSDGQKLAASPAKEGNSYVYSLANGTESGAAYGSGGRVTWLDDRFILVGTDLLAPGIKRPIWRYEFGGGSPVCRQGAWRWTIDGDTLVPT